MHDDRKAAQDRIARFLGEQVRPAVYSERIALDVSPLRVGDHSPDPMADQGRHSSRYGLRPAADIGGAITAGYTLPRRTASDRLRGKPLVSVNNPAVKVEAVKLADDRSGTVIVRPCKSRGGQARALMSADFAVTGACQADLLERPSRPMPLTGNAVPLSLRPFQIVTLRLER